MRVVSIMERQGATWNRSRCKTRTPLGPNPLRLHTIFICMRIDVSRKLVVNVDLWRQEVKGVKSGCGKCKNRNEKR
jgi:hypothetical protein